MGKRNMFVGLDVHTDTIDVSIAEGERQGEVRHYGVIAGRAGLGSTGISRGAVRRAWSSVRR